MTSRLRKVLLCLICVVSYPATTNSAENINGALSCAQPVNQAADDRGPCLLQWSLQTTPGMFLFIERFDLDTRSWERIGDEMPVQTRETRDAVQGPGLYRVAGCISRTRSRITPFTDCLVLD